MQKMSNIDINARRGEISEWMYDQNEDMITTTIEFTDFEQASGFVGAVADLAIAQEHHPDIYMYEGKFVQLLLHTADAGGVTEKDFELAKAIDQLLADKEAENATDDEELPDADTLL